jgi:DNA-binding beta-propeller fold protein YncE/mono/diheme cytochrome c family protein
MKRLGLGTALFLASCWAVSAPPPPSPPVLAQSSPFALPGSSLTFTVTGTPGASVQLLQTDQPAELDKGAIGILFYKQGTQRSIGSGTFDASGKFSHQITTSAELGKMFYVQAVAQLNSQNRMSNAVVYRIEASLPEGPRETAAIATTPDGRRAYVGHKTGGIVTVLDAVNNTKLTELPITAVARGVPFKPIRIAVDPSGRHAFVANAAAKRLTVIHAASGSISAQLPVPAGNRGIGFDFRTARLIYVANETTNSVLVFEETVPGTFVAKPSIPLQGHSPGPLLVLPDGRLAVGNRTEAEIEILDPKAAAGATTVARTPIIGVPFDLAWNRGEILVPSFLPPGPSPDPGYNRVVRLDGKSFQKTGVLFREAGTDCQSIVAQQAVAGVASFLAFSCSGTGTVVVADGSTRVLRDSVELAPGYPTATPQDVSVVMDAVTGKPARLFVVDFFRESVMSILLDAGTPYRVGPEIPLAWTGQVRVPLSGALSPAEDGAWFLRSVSLLGGTATASNQVTCNSCHMEGAASNIILSANQVPALWGSAQTAPYGWLGDVPTLERLVNSAVKVHNHTDVATPDGAISLVLQALAATLPPPSIYLDASGTLTAGQAAGKALFEGVAQCSACHDAPLFIPPPGSPRTFSDGIGTDLMPANVPSLRAVWATGPYLHDGRAKTLDEVLTINPLDAHGERSSLLTPNERAQLVEYLKTL